MIQQIINLYIKTVILKDKTSDLYKAYYHYTKIAKTKGIKINYLLKDDRYRANPAYKQIYVPLPTSLRNISIIYHELGHINHRIGSAKDIHGLRPSNALITLVITFGDPYDIIYECNANLWAIRNSPIKLDYQTLHYGLNTYLNNKERFTITPNKLLKKLQDQMLSRCKL